MITEYINKASAGNIYTGMPESDYHRHHSISNSGLSLIAKSPAHYRCRDAFEPTRAMEIGTAIHCAILEPDRFAREYNVIECPDKRAKAWREAVQMYGSDSCLTPGEYADVIGMQAAVLENTVARNLVAEPQHTELSAFVHDPETSVLVRCRYDLVTAGALVDLKSCRDARASEFARSVWSYRYHVQNALYCDVWRWLYAESAPPFWFVAFESARPHTVACYTLDDDAIAEGRRAYRRDLNTYAECLASDCWPKYEPESHVLSLPAYAIRQIEDELEVLL